MAKVKCFFYCLSFFVVFFAFGNDTNVPIYSFFPLVMSFVQNLIKVNGEVAIGGFFNFSNFFFDLFIERSILLVERFRHSFDVTQSSKRFVNVSTLLIKVSTFREIQIRFRPATLTAGEENCI